MVLAKALNEDNEVVLQHMFTGASSVAWKATWDKTQGCLLEKETNCLINFALLAVLTAWICLKKKDTGKCYKYLFLFYFKWMFPKDKKAFFCGENLIIQGL